MSDAPKANDGSDLDFSDIGLDDQPLEGGSGGGGDPFDFGSREEKTPKPAPKKSPSGGAARAPAPRAQPKTAAPGSGSPPREVGGVRSAVGLASDSPIQVIALMGRKTLTVGELVALKKGAVLELNRFPNEAIDLVANGKLLAKGELVEIDGKLGVRIIKIFE